MSTISAGTTTTTALVNTGDTTGNLVFQTNGTTTAMTIDTSQNVGIGTTSPANRLEVAQPQGTVIRVTNTTASGVSGNAAYTVLNSPAGDTAFYRAYLATADSGSTYDWGIGNFGTTTKDVLAFYSGGLTERMRIDSSGNVGIGTTSPTEKLRVVGTSGTAQFGAGTSGNAIFVNAFDSNPIYMTASATNSNAFGFGAASNIPLFFMTNNTERMRIDSSGNLLVGTTSNPGTRRFVVSSGSASVVESVYSTTAASNFAIFNACDTSGNNGTGYTMLFRGLGTSGTAEVALSNFIVNSTTVTMYGVYTSTVGATNRVMYVDSGGKIGYLSSTRASKTNIQNVPDASWLYQLKPVSFNYRKKDADGKYTDEADGGIQYGLIAEEVEQVKPDLCFYDEVDGKQELRGIHYEKLVVPMLKTIQELKTQNDDLRARVAALEGAK